jgi:periplasmic divalent cation tolerance protein
MSDLVFVVTTVADDEHAEGLARRLVDERLAACVNLLPPMVSCYRWKGAVERDIERLLIIKTTPERIGELEARLRELQTYQLPEFVVLNAEMASAAYLAWVREQT